MALLALILALLFWRSFLPDYVHFNNDGPLGQQNADWLKMPAGFFGIWNDLNDIGFSGGAFSPSFTPLLKWLLGPVGFSKFLPPITLFILGLGAWSFFRALKLTPLAAALGALAATLNSTFFSTACWGVTSTEIAEGMGFFALALAVANNAETPGLIRWIRLALAGLCVGVNVIETPDVGALISMLIAAFVFFRSLVVEDGRLLKKIALGASGVIVVAAFAGFIAYQTVIAVVGTSITGIAGTAQDAETRSANWDKATQWSLPKTETLGLFVPGLFGYKMDTPKDMMPAFQDAYRGGVYWGRIGRDPLNDRFYDSGGQGTPPNPGWMRQTGGGSYCGILVTLIAAFTIAQSFRRQQSPFTGLQKKFIWFWTVAAFVSLLFAWGRFAPFYALLYQLPYFSTIRNPAKFVIFFSWALIVLFAYGIDAFSRRQLLPAAVQPAGMTVQLQGWWKKAGAFDRKWTFTLAGIFGAVVLGWLLYSAQKPGLVKYLQSVGFPDEDMARQIVAFSLAQVVWFIALLAIALILLTLVIAGYFAGPRARLGGGLLGAFLLFDLGRADLPYICHWDYKQKYEIGTLNPVENYLRDKPYEHRVAILPFETQAQLRDYDYLFGGLGLYRIEWAQQHFPYYNIQSLDIVQMSRMPENVKAYLEAFFPRTESEAPLYARHWELTNTRYLLGPAGFLNVLNQQLDPVQQRFRILQRFDVVPKPGEMQPGTLEQLTATPSMDGDLALFEFTGALPRARLYTDWQRISPDEVKNFSTNNLNAEDLHLLSDAGTNGFLSLHKLAAPAFDPAQTVLLDSPLPEANPAGAAGENSGTVEFKSYAPTKIVFDAHASAPSILLLNDKYDPNWRVSVDGKPAELLRCNFIMRGVYLTPGAHTVEFQFSLPGKLLDITLAAIATGMVLAGTLIFLTRRPPAAAR